MIVEIFYKLWAGTLTMLSQILPSWDMPATFYDAIEKIAIMVNSLDFIFPFKYLLQCFLVVLAAELVIKLGKLFVSIANWLRGAGPIDIGIK